MQRLLCYAHFDECGELKPFVKYAISSMKELCVDILFVSNSPLSSNDVEYLQGLCSNVIINDNRGYDFYMWKLALTSVDYTNYDEVVLMNSSIFGPIFSLAPVFDSMAKRNCDFWGITECFQTKPHIQSYFLVFKRNVSNSEAFKTFWNGVVPSNNKSHVILSYEIGLTQWLIESGFNAEAYLNLNHIWNYCKSIGKKIKINDNYSVKHALELLQIGNLFLKVEPIKNNKIDKSLISELLIDNNYPIENLEISSKESTVSCPICDCRGKLHYRRTKDRLNLYVTDIYQYYKCSNASCGVLWIYPAPNEKTMKLMYNNYYTNEQSLQIKTILPRKPSIFRLIAVFIPKLILKAIRFHRKRNRFYLCDLDRTTPAKLLEIGCGSGDRIIKLNKAGWDVIGQDIDNNAYEKLTSNNIPFILGNTDQLKGEQFDVILLSHVIEHVKDPVSLLKECRRLLKSNGKLYITTPNNQSFTHKLFRRYWLGLDSPRHLIVYNINSLTNILSSSGYKNIKARTIAVNTEIFAMHSIDILRYKWTNVYSAPRIGKEFIPVFLQLTLFILNCITRVHGDECFVIASK